MRVLKLLVSSLLLAWLAFGSAAMAAGKTPEDAVAAYLEAVEARDFDAVMAATAVDEMSANFDFVAYIDRLQALVPAAPAPSSDPLFTAINRADFAAQIGKQIKFLAYGLLTQNDVLKGNVVKMDAAGAEEFVTEVDLSKLVDIKLEKVARPSPQMMDKDLYKKISVRLAKMYGANEATERVALISFGGADYMLGFTLLRYGVTWKVSSQTSALGGTDFVGVPKPITADEFDTLTK